jgi:hypothetical protein
MITLLYSRTRCRDVPKDEGQALHFSALLDEAQGEANLGKQHASMKKFGLEKRNLGMNAAFEEFI